MVLQLTQKLQKALGGPKLVKEHVPARPHMRWYANLFTVERVQYILTTNAASLFSVVLYKRGLTSTDQYWEQLLERLRVHMNEIGLETVFAEHILPCTDTLTLAKTEDRSVLGSMNDMINCCKVTIPYRGGMAIEDLTHKINDTTYSTIERRRPEQAMRELLPGDPV